MRAGAGLITGLIGILLLIGPEPFRKIRQLFLNDVNRWRDRKRRRDA